MAALFTAQMKLWLMQGAVKRDCLMLSSRLSNILSNILLRINIRQIIEQRVLREPNTTVLQNLPIHSHDS